MKMSPRLLQRAGYRVIVAEDNPAMRKMVVQILELDFEVVASFSSAESMMQMVLRMPPDVVICDLEFPAKSGLTALRELRGKGVHVPFVMISLDAGRQAECLQEGAHAFVSKEDLARHLARAVRAAAAGEHYAADD
jgi:DNA-binding NarL/FixJ family response regulator